MIFIYMHEKNGPWCGLGIANLFILTEVPRMDEVSGIGKERWAKEAFSRISRNTKTFDTMSQKQIIQLYTIFAF